MFYYAPVRMAVILVYFLTLSACGAPADTGQESTAAGENVAGDINFIGGGTAAPEITPEEEPYHSPTLSAGPPPESLTRASSIEQAKRTAQSNDKYKIMVWFHGADCVDCSEIEREILNDPDVINAASNWIFVFIDVDKNPERANYFLNNGDPPAFVAIDAYGATLRKKFGMVTKEEFLTMLQIWR